MDKGSDLLHAIGVEFISLFRLSNNDRVRLDSRWLPLNLTYITALWLGLSAWPDTDKCQISIAMLGNSGDVATVSQPSLTQYLRHLDSLAPPCLHLTRDDQFLTIRIPTRDSTIQQGSGRVRLQRASKRSACIRPSPRISSQLAS